MNTYLNAQIKNMITITKTFEEACKIATVHDDGTRTKEEQKQLKKIQAAAQKFCKELESIK